MTQEFERALRDHEGSPRIAYREQTAHLLAQFNAATALGIDGDEDILRFVMERTGPQLPSPAPSSSSGLDRTGQPAASTEPATVTAPMSDSTASVPTTCWTATEQSL